MSGNVSLTPKQEQFIDALLEGSTVVDAAEKCGVVERTAHRWLKQTDIQLAYEVGRKRLLNHSLTKLQLKFDKAINTLDHHLNATSTIPRDQVKAAEIIVDKTIQTAQLVERIAELETLLQEQEQDRLYKVIFDLRLLTKEEREALETIDRTIKARTIENAQ